MDNTSECPTHFRVVGLGYSQPPVPQATMRVNQIKLLAELFSRLF